MTQFATVAQASRWIHEKRPMLIAGDSELMSQLPAGPWIGGTADYFMTPEGAPVSVKTNSMCCCCRTTLRKFR